MNYKIINNIGEFQKIENAYKELNRESKSLFPFYSYRWITSWWAAYINQYKIFVFCIYDNDKLMVAIPLMIEKSTYCGLRLRKLLFLGKGWGAMDFPVHSEAIGWEKLFISWLLIDNENKWDMLNFGPSIPETSNYFTILNALEKNKFYSKVIEGVNPYLNLQGNWNDFLSRKSKNFRRTIKRTEKTAYESDNLSIRNFINPALIDLETTVFSVSKRSWQGKNGIAVASSYEGLAFYKALVSTSGEFDILLSALYSKDLCIGYFLGFIQNSTFHAFDTAFDPGFSEYSPGLLLHFNVLKEVLDHSVNEFNFGLDAAYKERFDPDIYVTYKIIAFRRYRTAYVAKLMCNIKKLLLQMRMTFSSKLEPRQVKDTQID